MEPTYHEAYWVAIATGAPVLSLAYIVIWERSLRHLREFSPRRLPWNNRLVIFTLVYAVGLGLVIPGVCLWHALNSLVDKADFISRPQTDIAGMLLSLGGLFFLTILSDQAAASLAVVERTADDK